MKVVTREEMNLQAPMYFQQYLYFLCSMRKTPREVRFSPIFEEENIVWYLLSWLIHTLFYDTVSPTEATLA
jgi:hypothetical protein